MGGPPLDKVQCRHKGERIGEEKCGPCGGNVRIKTFSCAIHGKCHQAAGKRLPGVACCTGCLDGPTVVRATAGGIGDALMGLCSVTGLKMTRPTAEIIYRVESSWQEEWVKLFTGYDRITTFETPTVTGRELPIHKSESESNDPTFRRPRWDHHASVIGAPCAVVPPMRPLPSEAVSWARDYAGAIVISPFSVWPDRAWPVERWATLERHLLELGYRVVILDGLASLKDHVRTEGFQSVVLRDEPAVRVAAVLREAVLFIGNDSGMAHAAGMLHTPSVVLSWFHDGNQIFGIYGTAKVIHTNSTRESITVPMVLEASLLKMGVKPPPPPQPVISSDRVAVLASEAARCARLPGDMAELGVYQGGSALKMIQAAPGKKLHLFDTWEGIPEDDIHPKGHKKGEFAADLETVKKTLREHEVLYHQGRFPATAEGLEDLRFCLVHLDGDLYESTRSGLAWFWPRMVPGGAIVLDDVGNKMCPGVIQALEEAGLMDQVDRRAQLQGVLVKKQ